MAMIPCKTFEKVNVGEEVIEKSVASTTKKKKLTRAEAKAKVAPKVNTERVDEANK